MGGCAGGRTEPPRGARRTCEHRLVRRVVVVLMLLFVACASSSFTARDSGVRCSGVDFDDVRGPVPSYARPPLASYPAEKGVCQAFWLPHADAWFVPQGLALDGPTAWVSGYRWRRAYGERPCRLIHVDLRTGRTLGGTARLVGSVGSRPPTFCRHGGALVLDRHGLWLSESDRLWLVDPHRVGRPDAVRRVWRTEQPVRGSAMMADADTLSLASYSNRHAGGTRVFSLAAMLAPGVTTLVPGDPSGATEVGPLRTSPAVRRVQGVAHGPGGTWSTSSTSTCGRLALPWGHEVALAPGVEDLDRDGHGGLWVVLESGARIYQREGRPLVPMLARYDERTLLTGPPDTCDW